MGNEKYKYSDITGKVIGCAMEVHNALGNGFQEVIYQRALELEFKSEKLSYSRELSMPVMYKGKQIGTRRVDFLVKEVISLEIKAVIELKNAHLAQAVNYLEAYNLEVGLLINFGSKSLEFKRLLNEKYKPEL